MSILNKLGSMAEWVYLKTNCVEAMILGGTFKIMANSKGQSNLKVIAGLFLIGIIGKVFMDNGGSIWM